MLAEHILFTVAIVIMVGVYFTRVTGKAYLWWLIILASFIPDADHINNIVWDLGLLQFPVHILPIIKIGIFHNLLWLAIFSVGIAIFFVMIKQATFLDVALFVAFGYALHLIEDFIVYPPVYQFLYPLSKTEYGWNILPETMDLGWAGTGVLNVGLVLIAFAICICILDKVQAERIAEKEETE